MPSQPAKAEQSTLGEYLRETRIKQGIDLETVAGETKISIKNLKALEESNFDILPAEAFTRGFYALYAQNLSLVPEEAMKMYRREQASQPKAESNNPVTPKMMAQEVGNMAAPPAFEPTSFVGMTVFLFLLLGAVICWYFSVNPAVYLSQQLRNLEHPQQYQQTSANWSSPKLHDSKTQLARWQQPTPPKHKGIFHLSYPATATAANIAEETAKNYPSQNSRFPKKPPRI